MSGISGIGGASAIGAGNGGMGTIQKLFEKLDQAMTSGNLSDASAALAELKKNAPPDAANNPMTAKLEALTKAVNAGDLKSAQQAYADVKTVLAQGHKGHGRPPGGEGRSGGAKGASAGSSTTKTFDKMDANQDGKVSVMEELLYNATHPTGKSDTTGLDVLA